MTKRRGTSAYCLPGFRFIHETLYPFVTGPRYNLAILRWQKICGLNDRGEPENFLIHFFFKFASTLGDEIFYLFPLLIWWAYPLAGPLLQCIGCTLPMGQFVKDMVHLPRPPRSFKYIDDNGKSRVGKIAKLEKAFSTEYGLPSTHAMSGSLSFCVLRTLARLRSCSGTASEQLGLSFGEVLLGVLITGSVCCSRLYMGVHSLADVAAGLLLSACLQALHAYYEPAVSTYMVEGDSAIWVPIVATVLFLQFYPRVQHSWSASYSTASELFGLWVGMSMSMWVANRVLPDIGADLKAMSWLHDHCAAAVSTASVTLSTNVLRLVSGALMVGTGRLLFKKLFFAAFMELQTQGWIAPMQHAFDMEGQPVDRHRAYNVEVPARLCTLLACCFLCVIATPLMWRQLGILCVEEV